MTEPVELRPAFSWDCPSCGREQFERGIVPEMSYEDREQLCDEQGIDPDQEGEWMLQPTSVTCRHCGESFDTVHFGEDE